MNHTKKHAHEFALHVQFPHGFTGNCLLTITDKMVVHRVNHVLRMQKSDQVILFNDHVHCAGIIEQIDKKSFTVLVDHAIKNELYTPAIVVELALLKREALDAAAHDLAVLGVQEIRLFSSEKVQRTWGGVQEYDRMRRCMITAAEQSKAFALPKLIAPVPFEQLIEQTTNEIHITCDSAGTPLMPILSGITHQQTISFLIGPEGDLTVSEKQQLSVVGYHCCRLTPTILRSESAAALAAGIIRSFFA